MKKNLLLFLFLIIGSGELFTAFIAAKSLNPVEERENNCICQPSLPVITKNLKSDFGAKGNNHHDDSWSFLYAADWLNKNCSDSFILRLYIPPGTYIAGMQLLPGEKITNPLCPGQNFDNNIRITRKGLNMLDLVNAKNIIISGSKRTVIKYKNGLLFGGFDKELKRVSWVPSGAVCSTTKDPSHVATIGTCISLKNCSCVTVEQLYMDGNNTAMNLGGVFGECNGYEIGHDGIDILGSKNIVIQNVTCNNFGRDGLMSCFSNGNPDCIQLKNVISNNNSRQGFSITAGTNFIIDNCSFSKTGTVFYSNPGAGVDIEPEFGGSCEKISFTNCEFLDNLFCGIISDNYFPDVSDITFNGCEFAASNRGSYSIWPRGMIRTAFNNCTIRGRFTHVAGIDSTDRMKFNNCTITDWRRGARDTLSTWGAYLMDFGTPAPDDHFYEFNYCKFEIHKSLAITTVENDEGNSERIFNHCSWKFYVKDLVKIIPHFPDTPSRGFLGRFIGCTFISNTFNEKSPSGTNQRLYFLEMDTKNNSTDSNNTFSPQNGLNGNKFCRVQNNPAWMYTYTFSLKDF